MSFVHGYLLAGLLLAGLPVLLHLVMRQKPRHLPFPAFRFLRQRAVTNRRRLRLQHLLLLLLRVGLIAGLCLALARPRVFSGQRGAGDGPVAAVLLFDTSASMEYRSGGRTRLDDARQRGRELLDDMAEGSQVAVLDSGDDMGADWAPTRDLVAARLDALRIRPANGPLTRQLAAGLRLLEQAPDGEDAPPRFLFVFSDRARACWDAGSARGLRVPPGVNVVFVDVGVEKPVDLAIDRVEVAPAVAAPGARVQVRAIVRSTGAEHTNEIVCRFGDGLDAEAVKKQVRLGPDRSEIVVFERTAPALPDGATGLPCPVTVALGTSDALPFNNTGHATFLVRPRRKILTIADRPADARIWKAALGAVGTFTADVRTPAEAVALDPADLAAYHGVCLFQASPPAALWDRLAGFVRAGGGLAIVPGGEELAERADAFNGPAQAHGLLPARLQKIETVPMNEPGIGWALFRNRSAGEGAHPLTSPFARWGRNAEPDFVHPEAQPTARRSWRVAPLAGTRVVAGYADSRPALVEKGLGKGRVVLFTVPLGGAPVEGERRWHNYWSDSSFGLVLADQVCRYLAGDDTAPELNYLCGQPVQALVLAPAEPPFTLTGPGLALAETSLPVPGPDARVPVPQAAVPGSYALRDGKERIVAGFSLNVRPEEGLLERVPAADLESVLGKDCLVQVGRSAGLREALEGVRPPPWELLPLFMVLVLLVLALEGLIAGTFARSRSVPTPDPARGEGGQPERIPS